MVVYKGIGFTEEWVAQQTLKQFTLHEKHHGLTNEEYEQIHKICKDLRKSANPEPSSTDSEAIIRQPRVGFI